jgi:hypothetical protein
LLVVRPQQECPEEQRSHQHGRYGFTFGHFPFPISETLNPAFVQSARRESRTR